MNRKLIDCLVAKGLLTLEQGQELLAACEKERKTARELILEQGLVPEDGLVQALSEIYRIPLAPVYEVSVPPELLHMMSPDVLRANTVFPYAFDPEDRSTVHVALSDPLNIRGKDVVAAAAHCRVKPFLATSAEILLSIDRCYGAEEMQGAAEQFTSTQTVETEQVLQEQIMQEDISSSPVVTMVTSLIEQAVRQRASDIHVEAEIDRVRVRFRIDGILYQQASYDIRLLAAIITRIKVMSGMYISEKRRPQDGQFSVTVDRMEYDVRVSTLPTMYGEKCVLRLSQKAVLRRDKRELGLSEEDLVKFNRIMAKPYGLVLVTGPTGSGKSTTLYTALSALNSEAVNIVTVEDPVEASIPGINQVQVNTKADLTFANVLRSILRQDPDIIMVGEIRDGETAAIAIQASITGHLVVSTLHTNDTASSVTRLVDMGVEPYLIADATVGIIAQRLVRRLCPFCRKKRKITPGEAEYLKLPPEEQENTFLHDPAGCQHCGNTGYYGRIGVYEIMEITPEVRTLIAAKASTGELREAAEGEGMQSLWESTRRLVLQGVTSLGEMMRISAGGDSGDT